jgi:hypothetical protein
VQEVHTYDGTVEVEVEVRKIAANYAYYYYIYYYGIAGTTSNRIVIMRVLI